MKGQRKKERKTAGRRIDTEGKNHVNERGTDLSGYRVIL